MPDKCPWCGSEAHDKYNRLPQCYESQIARMQPVIDALSKYITDLRGDASGMDLRWITVSDAWDKYKESEPCNPS